ncbi:ABC transporter permease [Roseomonas elaeocarpi]|uniref:ABC transporter permease n=1 Tax=Roseomonas elaeocarpi TaxID=907779 RepID=A0ABV6JTF6_9PROT
MSTLATGWRFARRELRGGIKGLRIVLACLALGVAAIAAVGTLRSATEAGLAADGAKLLGGDLEVRSTYRPLPEEALRWLREQGATVSETIQMRAMAVAGGPAAVGGTAPVGGAPGTGAPDSSASDTSAPGAVAPAPGTPAAAAAPGTADAGTPAGAEAPAPTSGRNRSLVELKAVDGSYPLYGALVLDPPGGLAQQAEADGRWPLALERVVLDRLGLKTGDTVRIGEARFALRGVVAEEPDKVSGAFQFGPRATIPLAAVPATALIQPGSLVTYAYRLRLPAGVAADGFADRFRAQRFFDSGWRLRDATEGAPGVGRFVDSAASFLTLAGLTALLVGGIGVATGVRSWLDRRARTIATLRCLGAPASAIFVCYLLQVLVLAAAGIVAGLVAGTALTWIAATALAGVLPVPPRLGFYPAPLALAALYGLLTALAFSLWPLARAREIPGAALFRDAVQPVRGWPRLWLLLLNAAAGLVLVALVVLTSDQKMFALWFCLGALLTLGLFRAGAWALQSVARRFRGVRQPVLRLGLANLHRPGAPTALMLVSLGIGLTTLAAVALIEGNLRRQIGESIPDQAPSFFFIDIQSDQAGRFEALARGVPGVEDVVQVPSLRARITAIKGVPVEQVHVSEDSEWALRGDRGLTYAATPPEGTRLVAGQWWPADYRGAPLVSLDANLARGWGVNIGDTVTLNVLGRDVSFEVRSLRDIQWRGLGLNFALIASPGLLESAPHTNIATVRAAQASEAGVLRAVTDALPNVTGISVREALDALGGILGQIATALTSTAALTLLAGILVLAGAVAAGQAKRIRDAVILKTVGATRGQIRNAWLVEFGLLGLTAGLIAAAAGTLASWGVVRFVMKLDWAFLPGTLAVTVLGCALLTLAMGWAGTALALRVRPAPLLRNE